MRSRTPRTASAPLHPSPRRAARDRRPASGLRSALARHASKPVLAAALWSVAIGLLAPAHVSAQSPPPTDPAAAGSVAATDESDDTLTWSVKPGPAADGSDRPNYTYDLEPGSRISDSIVVRNFGAEPLPLVIYASDGRTTSSGALDLLPAGEPSVDVGSWVVLDSVNIEVPANGTLTVPFTLTVPADAEAGDHTGGIVTSFRSPGTDDQGQAVVVDRRLGSRVHVRVGGELRPALEVSDLSVDYSGTANPFGTGTAEVTYTVTNTGNVRLAAEQTITVPGRFGFPGRKAQLEPMGELLPGNSLTFTAEVPDVWATLRTGVTVELTPIPTRAGDVFPDSTPAATASASTWSPPWTLLALLVAAIGIPLWNRASRKRRQRRTAQEMQQMIQTAVMVQEAVRTALHGGTDAAPASNGHIEHHPGPDPTPLQPADVSAIRASQAQTSQDDDTSSSTS